ncbi:uroporphyrinogen decarboxylase [candidate division KSB1 bacterium]|nr:uroporphyrinogen decarboxylase [candidate division KSB1 bacterium]
MSKQLLFDALKGKITERPAWVPFVGCHGGALIDKSAETYLRSVDLMIEGTRKAIELYDPDGIPVNFDLSVEAEALGCGLRWSAENPPAIVDHVLADKTIRELPTVESAPGRIEDVVRVIERLKQEDPDVGLYGLVTGPFTLALHLQGTDIFMDMYDKPEKVKELLEFTMQVGRKVADLYIDAGIDIVSLVDPMTSQISPQAFRKFISPFAVQIFDHIRSRDVFSSFFVCGHAQKNVQAMCETGPDNISVDENIPLDYVKEICRSFDLSFGGNLKLTTTLLMGSEDDVRRNVIECMDVGGDTGFILAPGCDLPYAVPAKNLQLVAGLVRDEYQQQVARELLASHQQVDEGMNLSEYGQADKVVVDVITLDSESCPPCQYMVEAVKAVVPYFGELVVWRERPIKEKESVEFMMGLMVKNVPTICIDGKIKFVSTIPPRHELIAAIQERINEKFSMRLRQHRGQLLVLGDGDKEFQQVWENAQQAAKELGSSVELVSVTDKEKIRSYGVASTPAVVAVKENVKSVGRIPNVEVIKEWLKILE